MWLGYYIGEISYNVIFKIVRKNVFNFEISYCDDKFFNRFGLNNVVIE